MFILIYIYFMLLYVDLYFILCFVFAFRNQTRTFSSVAGLLRLACAGAPRYKVLTQRSLQCGMGAHFAATAPPCSLWTVSYALLNYRYGLSNMQRESKYATTLTKYLCNAVKIERNDAIHTQVPFCLRRGEVWLGMYGQYEQIK